MEEIKITNVLLTRYQIVVSMAISLFLINLYSRTLLFTILPFFACLLLNVVYSLRARKKVVNTHKSSVLVTGTSTGIGFACVEQLVKEGFYVFAGVRNDKDAQSVKDRIGSDLVHPLILDVTDSSSIKRAVGTVESESEKRGRVFMGLVNNAGIAASAPVEVMPLDHAKKMFDVNVFGLTDMIQQFLPLLRASADRTDHRDARIVNVSSVAGLLSGTPYGMYNASKFSVQCITASVKNENAKYRVRAVTVNPGSVKTEFTTNAFSSYGERILAEADSAKKQTYRRFYESLEKRIQEANTGKHPIENGIDPKIVGDSVVDCLTRQHPDNVNIVGKESLSVQIVTCLPQWIIDRIVRKMFPVN